MNRSAVVLAALTASCLSPDVRQHELVAQPHHFESIHSGAPLAIGATTWTSPWMLAPCEFDEALPSWNVDVPAGAAFRVEVRVATGAKTSPTEWLDIGGWGAWPTTKLAPSMSESGRVEIDLLKLNRLHDRLQVRMHTANLGGGEHITLQRLNVTFTDSAKLRAQASFALPIEFSDVIAVPLRRQTDEQPELAARVCSPTSLAMVLEFWGLHHSVAEVAELCYDREHDIYGNWNRAVQGAYVLGLSGTLWRFNDWTEASFFLREGLPLVISIGVEPGQLTGAPYESTAGHLLVLCGFDDDKQRAIVMDPAVPRGDSAAREYALDELEECWLRRGGFAYVFTPTRAEDARAPE